MPSPEHQWTEKQIGSLVSTVREIRKIRSAATHQLHEPTTVKEHLLRTFTSPFTPDLPKERQEILSDAERLAHATTEFFVRTIMETSSGAIEEEFWHDTLSDIQKTYVRFRPTTRIGSHESLIAANIIGHVKLLTIDPDHILQWYFFTLNNIGNEKTVDELLSGSIGVVSPLTGDYLLACTFQSYLDQQTGKRFVLKPTALSKNLQDVLLPTTEGKPSFQEMTDIGIFIDVIESGKTARAVLESIAETYPTQRIHRPTITHPQTIPFSPKINSYLNS